MIVLDPNSSRPLRGVPVAVLDFETTGPDPQTCFPVQVGIVRCFLGDSEPWVRLDTLVNPGVPIDPGATAVHHITDEQVANAPRWLDMVDEIVRLLDDHLLVAYNLPFDWQILRRGVIASGRDASVLPFGGLDPLVGYKVAHRYEKGKKLVDAAAYYGETFGAHNAAEDARVTAKILPRILHDLGQMPVCGRGPLLSVGAMWAWTRRHGLNEEESYVAWCAKNDREPPKRVWQRLLAEMEVSNG